LGRSLRRAPGATGVAFLSVPLEARTTHGPRYSPREGDKRQKTTPDSQECVSARSPDNDTTDATAAQPPARDSGRSSLAEVDCRQEAEREKVPRRPVRPRCGQVGVLHRTGICGHERSE
ncbi:hypothetical protein THAOC_31838, partial [Thalassiosira oceanica]